MEVLFLDNHLLVVVKPAGMLSQADRTGDEDLLSRAKRFLKNRFDKPGDVYLGLVHRLDRPVSGVMVFARTSKAAGRLATAFRERDVEKRYLAIVEGGLSGEGECEDFLRKEEGRVRVVEPSDPKGKRARLRWRSLGSRGGLSLVDVELLTGRPHQVRVQLSARGHPILGDLRYGARQEFDGRNLALHAYGLALEHPVRRHRVEFAAPPPVTWKGRFDDQIGAICGSSQGPPAPSPEP